MAPGSGERFLAGDAINTASRIQSVAPLMGVAVGQSTVAKALLELHRHREIALVRFLELLNLLIELLAALAPAIARLLADKELQQQFTSESLRRMARFESERTFTQVEACLREASGA